MDRVDRHRSASLLIIVFNYVIKVEEGIVRPMQMHKILSRYDILCNLSQGLLNILSQELVAEESRVVDGVEEKTYY
jgi:hypothetical protein